jgi:hypothetical protein
MFVGTDLSWPSLLHPFPALKECWVMVHPDSDLSVREKGGVQELHEVYHLWRFRDLRLW